MEWVETRTSEPSISTPQSASDFCERSTMRVLYFSNEFPHDDLEDLLRRLHVHSKNSQYPNLSRFIHKATLAVRHEVRLLPNPLRKMVPHFESILDFVNQATLRSGPLGASIDGVLLCAVQLGCLIGYYENHPEEEFDLHAMDTTLAGLGLGLLTTAAIALSPKLSDVVLAGTEVVRLAFRLGVVVDEVSQNLQPCQSSPDSGHSDSWAYVVPNVVIDEVKEELDAIHTAEKTPEPNKVFISALNRTSVTVSGPPSRLKHIFLHSNFFRDRKSFALQVYGGLCHAKHIYNKQHIENVLETTFRYSESLRMTPRLPIFSTSTGKPFKAISARELFHSIIEEILTKVIQWDNVIQGILHRANTLAAVDFQVFCFRVSVPVHDLMETLTVDHSKRNSVDFMEWVAQTEESSAPPCATAQSKIAIVGMSCRLPDGATDTEKFWSILEHGLDVTRKIPADRFDVETHCDPTGKRQNTSHTPWGCFINEPGLFDAPFFNMSPREAQQTDPMQRLALVTAYEALERAGYVANRTSATDLHRIGTCYGQASDDYREVNTGQDVGTYFITGGCRAFGPGRINYFFKFGGPSYTVDTACSSGLAAIQTACTALWNGEVDTVVAGGLNVLTNSDAFAGLSMGHFLSKTPGACKTWDCDADGYCRADGIVSIVMKRLEDAEADNDNILGMILGAGTNHSAEAISITHPHAGAQSYLSRQVLRQAGINPLDVSFVEMHGTGTQAGDAQEIKSVTDVFAPLTKRRNSKQPLHIGAVKGNVGHGEAVAGPTALLKVLLMLEKEIIPPHVGIKNSINPGFPKDFDKRNLHIPYNATPWHRNPEKKRIAIVNSFSAAGGNTTLAIEEGPIRELPDTDPRTKHLITVSAKSKISLKGNLERLIAYLEANPNVSLPNLAYTTSARRYHHNYRMAVATTDVSHLKKHLQLHLQSVESHKPIPATGAPPVVFAFTGQGASHRSMNLQLFRDCHYFRSQLLHLDSLSQTQGFPSFIPAIDGSFSQDHVHSPVVSQLALVCVEIALAKYWISLEARPDVVVGHSLGEYAALHISGVLSASDVIFLVGRRAAMLEEKCQSGSHKMLAVRASLAQVQEVAGDEPYEVACINGPKDTVLSATGEQVNTLVNLFNDAGYKSFSLDVAFAFHSAQTDAVLDDFEQIAEAGVLFQPPNLPIISPLLGKVIFDDKTVNANYVRRATRETVDFLTAVETANKTHTIDETMVWIEIGPHPVCVGFAKSILPSLNVGVPSLRRGEDNWHTMSQSLGLVHCAGIQIGWNEFHRPFEPHLRLLDLPTYAWNEKTHWLQYNGDWALTKGNTFYDAEKAAAQTGHMYLLSATHSSLRTSLVQHIIEEDFSKTAGRIVMRSDMMQPDFLAATYGHEINGCGVATSSIHGDIAFTLGEYLMKNIKPQSKGMGINITDLQVSKGLVAQKNTEVPQLIQVSAEIENVESGIAHLKWQSVHNDGEVDEPFATAKIIYGMVDEWLSSWIPMAHLIESRIEALDHLVVQGVANRLSHDMAYLLFARNLVDYAEKYRGMQSVVMSGLEAYADVSLTKDKGGVWTIPPYFIDSLVHLAGFVMNVSDAMDTKANFCVTPGWGSMRFAKHLVPGAKYRSYVKMIPTEEDASVYLGDVYVLQDGVIMGMVGAIKFRQYPRILLNRFFSAPESAAVSPSVALTKQLSSKQISPLKEISPPETSPFQPAPSVMTQSAKAVPVQDPPQTTAQPVELDTKADPDNTVTKAMALVALEAGLEVSDLKSDESFGNLGIDSLMSLVIAEKFREQLGVTVNGSLFLEYPTVGDLQAWLVEYYS